MRARTNVAVRRAAHSHDNNGAAENKQEEAFDRNGKDKPNPKFKRPPMASFKLIPPPPKMTSLSAHRDSGMDGRLDRNNVISSPQKAVSSGIESVLAAPTTNSVGTATLPPAVSRIPIPPPQPSRSLVQRITSTAQTPSCQNNKQPSANAANISVDTFGSKKSTPQSYSNPYSYQAPQQNFYSSDSQISHPYKPSPWYAHSRNIQRKHQFIKKVVLGVMATILIVSLWRGYHYIISSNQNVKGKRRHKNYHHHDRHHHFHPMLGIMESPIGFSKESTPSKKSYRQLEQEHPSSDVEDHGQSHIATDDLFSTFPVTTLSNKRLFPVVGFGVTSRSVEHKEIPSIVSTLLQYASSETLGGGGIAMIDAVVDEEKTLEESGGSLQFSITRKGKKRYNEGEEKLESAMAKTCISLVGRAINFFAKESNKLRKSGVFPSAKSISRGSDYDYENRLEVHLLMGLSNPDLGAEKSVAVLGEIAAELDGLVHPLPASKDVLHADLSDWIQPSAPTAIDPHVDVRLHVLLRLSHCHPCSSDKANNKDLLDNWVASYTILEKLYEAKIIHGLGLDGVHSQDIQYLLDRCKIKPHLYRGIASQALGMFGNRTMATHEEVKLAGMLEHNHITFLASNVAGHVLDRKSMAPNAYALLQNLGGVLYRAHHAMMTARGEEPIVSTGHKGEGQYYTVPRVVLSYLVRHKVCVLPHAFKAEHLADDAPESVYGLSKFLTERRMAEIELALKALLKEEDIPEDHGLGMEGETEVAAVFQNKLTEEVSLFHVDDKDAVITPERGWTAKGSGLLVVTVNNGDKFSAYGSDGRTLGTYKISAKPGGASDFTIPPASPHHRN